MARPFTATVFAASAQLHLRQSPLERKKTGEVPVAAGEPARNVDSRSWRERHEKWEGWPGWEGREIARLRY
jgi:hypothetical protein